MGKFDHDELWKQIMDAEGRMFSNPSDYNPSQRYPLDDDDGEDFLTSKEINPKQDKRERSMGSPGTSGARIEEEVYFKRYRTQHEHKYTEKEIAQMRASCKGVIVHDYSANDLYHMDDEERKKIDMLNELRGKLNSVRGTYHKVDKWIEAMRVVVQAWEIFEEKGNFIFTKDEFFSMVAEGKIVSNGLVMPKLKRMNTYDIDTLMRYISNPELDPADLLALNNGEDEFETLDDDPVYCAHVAAYIQSYVDEYGQEEYEEEQIAVDREAHEYAVAEMEKENIARILSEEERQYIIEYRENPKEFKVKDLKRKMIKGYDQRALSSKQKRRRKKMSKKKKYQIESLHDILNKIQTDVRSNPDYVGTRSLMVTNSMFDPPKPPKSFMDDLYYDGSWVDKDQLFLYDLVFHEELMKQKSPTSRYLTYGDQELQRFFKLLEENDVNTLDLRRKMDVPVDAAQRIEDKATRKQNKKMESQLIQRITKLNANPKFKKIVSKAEKALNEQFKDY